MTVHLENGRWVDDNGNVFPGSVPRDLDVGDAFIFDNGDGQAKNLIISKERNDTGYMSIVTRVVEL